MKRMLEVELEGEETILVEIEETEETGITRATGGSRTGTAKVPFEQAIGKIQLVAKKLIGTLGDLAQRPDQIAVEFGFKLGGKTGVIIASTQTEANFKVRLTWDRFSSK